MKMTDFAKLQMAQWIDKHPNATKEEVWEQSIHSVRNEMIYESKIWDITKKSLNILKEASLKFVAGWVFKHYFEKD